MFASNRDITGYSKVDNQQKPDQSENYDDENHDPRMQCCWKGKYFFDALKATATRMIFALHAFLAIWQVTIVTRRAYWWFVLSFLGIIVETLYVLFKRRGQEWKW